MQWIVTLDPVKSGDICKIEIVDSFDGIVLEDVTFGDVWFCSGQSNMGWTMLGAYCYCLSNLYEFMLGVCVLVVW